MRAVRWILGIAAAAVLLAVASVLIATQVINPDRYKGRIESVVRRETGRPFLLQGHLRLSWFPWIGVRTGAAQLGNPPGTTGPDLLAWQTAQVRVRVLPLLLHRQIEIGRIRIVGADIHLRRSPDGRGNWDDLVARLHPAGQPQPPARPAPAAWPITLAGLDLESGSLDYVDARSGQHLRLSHWQLRAGSWRAGRPLPVSTSFLLQADAGAGPPGNHTAPAGTGVLRLPPAGIDLSIAAPALQIQASPLTVTAPRWSLQIGNATLHGAMDASRDPTGQVTASGSLTAAVPSVRGLTHSLGLDVPPVKDPAALGPLSLSGSWSYRGGALRVEPLTASLDATTVTGWIARSGGASPAWTFALRADELDLGRYLTQQKQPLKLPVRELRALHAQGTLELGRARIDGTTLNDVRLEVQ